jgi:peptide/nickel transport system substrate-binding protein
VRPSDTFTTRGKRTRSLCTGVCIALLLVLAAALLLAGCGKDETTTSSTAAQESTSTTAAVTQGITLESVTPAATGTVDHINWNILGGEPPTLDPARSGTYGNTWLSSQIYDTLLRFSPDWTLNPCIAESWKQVDPVTLVFTIRKDAKFWDGNPVTVDDVIYSMERQRDPTSGAIYAGLFAKVTTIEKTGPSEVTFKFAVPDQAFVKMMATSPGMIVEKAFVEKAGQAYGSGPNIMGSGTYKLASWTSGTNIELQANADYWDANLKPKVQAVTIQFLTDTSTITSAFMSGELDGMYEAPPTAIPALQTASDAAGKLHYGPGLIMTAVAPANPAGPMGNTDVRKALLMAIDRQSIVDKVFYGAANVCKTATPQTAWYPEAKDIFEQAYAALPGDKPDLEAAKQLIAAAGDAAKTPMVMGLPAGDQTMLQMGAIVQQAAKDIGLTVELKPMQPLDYLNSFYVAEFRTGIDMLLTLGYLNIPDPLDLTVILIGPYSILNWIGWTNPEAEAALDKAYTTFDPIERAKLVVAAQKIYTEDAMTIPLTSNDEILFLSDRISGAPTSFAYMFMPGLAMLGGTK